MKYKFNKFENELEKLLKKYYKDKWLFRWKGFNFGFELTIHVDEEK